MPPSDASTTVVEAAELVLDRKGTPMQAPPDADLFEDLGMESLDVAELSAILEDTLGSDPFSAGLLPRTLAEVIRFYE